MAKHRLEIQAWIKAALQVKQELELEIAHKEQADYEEAQAYIDWLEQEKQQP